MNNILSTSLNQRLTEIKEFLLVNGCVISDDLLSKLASNYLIFSVCDSPMFNFNYYENDGDKYQLKFESVSCRSKTLDYFIDECNKSNGKVFTLYKVSEVKNIIRGAWVIDRLNHISKMRHIKICDILNEKEG